MLKKIKIAADKNGDFHSKCEQGCMTHSRLQ